jgi:hypothetical protein
MVIDTDTGALRWQPHANQIGKHTVKVQLSDTYGSSATQEYLLTLNGNNLPPTITSSPY